MHVTSCCVLLVGLQSAPVERVNSLFGIPGSIASSVKCPDLDAVGFSNLNRTPYDWKQVPVWMP
jgi:hypothetical protein